MTTILEKHLKYLSPTIKLTNINKCLYNLSNEITKIYQIIFANVKTYEKINSSSLQVDKRGCHYNNVKIIKIKLKLPT